MKQLIVASLPAEETTVQDLAPGEGGFLTDIENPNAVAIDLDAVDKDAKIQVVHKTKKGKVQVSPVFTLNQIAEALYKVYNAGTKQKWTITPVIPAVQEKGMEWTVKLVDTTGGNLSVDQKSFNVVHTGVDFTAASLVAAFKTKINDSTFKAVATGTNTLIIEAETPDNHFSVAVDNEMENASVVLTTRAMPSSGTTEKMKELEKQCQSFSEGVTNKVMYPTVIPDSEIADGNYNTHIFTLMLPYNAKDGNAPRKYNRQMLYIASTVANNPLGKVLFDQV